MTRDYGFAPNPFFGFCTLANCKPKIRKSANVGDWIIGTGCKTRKLEYHLTEDGKSSIFKRDFILTRAIPSLRNYPEAFFLLQEEQIQAYQMSVKKYRLLN